MKFNFFKQFSTQKQAKTYFCPEPWIGIFSIETNMNVTFCPCYLKMKIGNLKESSIPEIWNSEKLVSLRQDFEQGKLPEACKGQVCSVALGQESPAIKEFKLSKPTRFSLRSLFQR